MLKIADTGLSKAWKPVKTQESFYSGGKFEICKNDGAKVLLCVHDENVSVVDWVKGILSGRLLEEDPDSDLVDMITSFCVHPNGSEIVVSLRNLLLRHYRLGDKEPVRSIRGHQMPVVAMAYDRTGTLVATGSADKTVRVWDIPRGHCTHSFREHSDVVQMVRFHPDPSRLVLFSGSDDSTLRMYDLKKSTCVSCFRQHMSLPTALSFSEDGNLMTSCGRDQVLNFYSINGKPAHLKTVPVMDELEGVQLLNAAHSAVLLGAASKTSAKGKKRSRDAELVQRVLVTGGLKGVLRLFTVSYEEASFAQFSCAPLSELSTLSAPLVVGRCNGENSQEGLMRAIKGVSYDEEDEEIIAVTADNNFCCFSIDSSNHSLKWSRQIVGSCDDILDTVIIPEQSADSTVGMELDNADVRYRVAVVTNSPLVQIIDQNQRSVPLSGHSDTVLAADVTSDGLLLITSSKDRTCRVWDLTTMTNCAVAEGHTEAVGCVAISKKLTSYTNNQTFAVSGAGDKILKRWAVPIREFEAYSSVPSGTDRQIVAMKASHSVRAHDKDINTVAVAPNDSLVASGSQDHSIRIWKSTDLSPLATLTGHKRGVWRVVFSPVDRSLASASSDRTVRLWSLNDNSCLRTFQGHTASVLNVRFVNHGTQLISAASDGLINLWTIRNGDCESTLDGHDDKVWALANVSDSHFISGGSDAKLTLWKDVTEEAEKDRLKELESDLLTEQELANDIRNKNYSKAFSLSLKLGHSNKILGILMKILDLDIEEAEAEAMLAAVDTRVSRLDQYLGPLSDEELEKLLPLLADWNTNAKFGFVSQAALASLFRTVKMDRLLHIQKFVDLAAGILSYSERHYSRIDRLHEASYLIDFISGQVGVLGESASN